MVRKPDPLISILLPTHNRADVIGACLESVIAQTYQNWELLIVDDGCTDATKEIGEKYQKIDSRIKIWSFSKGPGFGYAHRNTVLQHARGDYIAFAAHDDVWCLDHLDRFVAYFDTYPTCQFAYSRPWWIHPDGTIIPSLFNITDPDVFQVFMHHYNEIPANCVMYSHSALKAVGYWDHQLPKSADLALWRSIVKHISPEHIPHPLAVGFVSEPTAFHTRAVWRTSEDAWNAQLLKTYTAVHARPSYLAEHRLGADHVSDQPWRLLDLVRDTKKVEALRRSSRGLIDALARDTLTEKNSLTDLDRITQTRGYRALEQLRAIRAFLTGRKHH